MSVSPSVAESSAEAGRIPPVEILGRWNRCDLHGQVVGQMVVVPLAAWKAMSDDQRPDGVTDNLGQMVLIYCPVGWGESR